MYCAYCGGTFAGSCRVCGRRVCARHRGRWLGVCTHCRPAMVSGGVVAAVALAAGLLLWRLFL
jgi:hypothetical protein